MENIFGQWINTWDEFSSKFSVVKVKPEPVGNYKIEEEFNELTSEDEDTNSLEEYNFEEEFNELSSEEEDTIPWGEGEIQDIPIAPAQIPSSSNEAEEEHRGSASEEEENNPSNKVIKIAFSNPNQESVRVKLRHKGKFTEMRYTISMSNVIVPSYNAEARSTEATSVESATTSKKRKNEDTETYFGSLGNMGLILHSRFQVYLNKNINDDRNAQEETIRNQNKIIAALRGRDTRMKIRVKESLLIQQMIECMAQCSGCHGNENYKLIKVLQMEGRKEDGSSHPNDEPKPI